MLALWRSIIPYYVKVMPENPFHQICYVSCYFRGSFVIVLVWSVDVSFCFFLIIITIFLLFNVSHQFFFFDYYNCNKHKTSPKCVECNLKHKIKHKKDFNACKTWNVKPFCVEKLWFLCPFIFTFAWQNPFNFFCDCQHEKQA